MLTTIYNHWFKKISALFYRLKTGVVYPRAFEADLYDNILVLAPHPDDESIGCAGLLLQYPEKTTVVCVTDGRFGEAGEDPELTASRRKQEFHNAMAKAGVKATLFLGFADGQVDKSLSRLDKQLDFAAYDLIVLPSNFDQHPDHVALTRCVIKIARQFKQPQCQFLFYEVWSALPLSNCFIRLDNWVEQKRELIACYKSQANMGYAERILALNRYRGMLADCEYAEAYHLLDAKTFKNL